MVPARVLAFPRPAVIRLRRLERRDVHDDLRVPLDHPDRVLLEVHDLMALSRNPSLHLQRGARDDLVLDANVEAERVAVGDVHAHPVADPAVGVVGEFPGVRAHEGVEQARRVMPSTTAS